MTYPQSDLAKGAGLYTEHIQGGGAVTAYSVVYVDATGRWVDADADAVATMPVVGLATEPLSIGQKGRVLQQGYANLNTWTWTPGGLLYASTTAGELTQTPPVGPGDVVQEIGVAITATMIYFDGAGLGGTGSAGAGTLLAGATAYVGSEATLAGYANYFYTGDYGTHTLLLAAAIDYVGTLGGGSISLEAMTFTGVLVVDEDEVEVYGQGWDTYINGATTGDAIDVSGDRCVIRDLQCGTTAGGANDYDGIAISGTDCLIDNVFVNGSDARCIHVANGYTRITNCYLYDSDLENVYANSPSIITGNELEQSGTYGVRIGASGDATVVSNNVIVTTGNDGVLIDADAENCVVDGNHITGWTGEAIDDDSLTSSIGNDNWAGGGSYQIQTGIIAEPTVTAGGAWEGRIIQVENSDEARYFQWCYKNGGWRGVEYL